MTQLTPQLTTRELATVLAALRHWQRYLDTSARKFVRAEYEHFTDEAPLTPRQIDDLCERLNTRVCGSSREGTGDLPYVCQLPPGHTGSHVDTSHPLHPYWEGA